MRNNAEKVINVPVLTSHNLSFPTILFIPIQKKQRTILDVNAVIILCMLNSVKTVISETSDIIFNMPVINKSVITFIQQ